MVTPARMVSVVLMVEGQGVQVLTTLGLLVATVQGTLLTMLAIPIHSRLTTLILGKFTFIYTIQNIPFK